MTFMIQALRVYSTNEQHMHHDGQSGVQFAEYQFLNLSFGNIAFSQKTVAIGNLQQVVALFKFHVNG